MRGPHVCVDLLHLFLNLRSRLHLDGSLVDCIFRPALIPSWDWARELCAVAPWLCLLLHPICGKALSIMPAYLCFHIRHTWIWYFHVMSVQLLVQRVPLWKCCINIMIWYPCRSGWRWGARCWRTRPLWTRWPTAWCARWRPTACCSPYTQARPARTWPSSLCRYIPGESISLYKNILLINTIWNNRHFIHFNIP